MDILAKINWVDIVIVTILMRICYVALQDGLSHEIFPLVGTALTAAISLQYYHNLASFIKNLLNLPISILDFTAFLVLVVGVGLLFKLAKVLIDIMMQVTWNPFLEKFGGAFFGLLRGSVIISLLLIILSLAPLSYMQHSIRDRSMTGMFFLKIAPAIHSRLAWMLPTISIENKAGSVDSLVKTIVSDKSVKTK
jgi:membrane protein required for colicin V production